LVESSGKRGDRTSSRVGTCTSGLQPLVPETGVVVFGSRVRTYTSRLLSVATAIRTLATPIRPDQPTRASPAGTVDCG